MVNENEAELSCVGIHAVHIVLDHVSIATSDFNQPISPHSVDIILQKICFNKECGLQKGGLFNNAEEVFVKQLK